MPSPDKDDAITRGQISPQDRAELRGRTDELDRRLQQARGQVRGEDQTTPETGRHKPKAPQTANKGLGGALRSSTGMIAGVLVGSGIGWAIDKVFGTWPAFFIVFFLLGSAAGMLNVVREGLKMKTGPSDPKKGPSVPDDEDDN